MAGRTDIRLESSMLEMKRYVYTYTYYVNILPLSPLIVVKKYIALRYVPAFVSIEPELPIPLDTARPLFPLINV